MTQLQRHEVLTRLADALDYCNRRANDGIAARDVDMADDYTYAGNYIHAAYLQVETEVKTK